MNTRSGTRIVRERERAFITGISRSTWWRLHQAGETPKKVRLSKNSVGWLLDDLQDWLRERAGREVV
jgi:predicted DNA-binding transcriptional regulator AlpA